MAAGTIHSTGIARHTIWAARLVVLAVFLDLFVQFPTIAPYAEGLGASVAVVGIVVAAYSFTNLFGNLGAGFVLDRWGRRFPIVLGLVITTIAVFCYSLVQTPEQLIVVRAIHGIGAAVLAPGAFTMIGDRAPADRWGRAMGLTGALIAVAALVGPPVAGVLRDTWGADAVFYVDSAVLLTTLIIFLVVARDDGVTPEAEGPDAGVSPATRLHETRAVVRIWRRICHYGRYRGARHVPAADAGEPGGVSGADRLHLRHIRVRGNARHGKPAQPGQRPVRPVRPADSRPRRVAAGLAILGFFTEYAGVAVGMAVFGFGYGIVFPSAAALVIGATGAERRGMAFGVFYAVYSFGVVVGASGSGLLADLDGAHIGLPFLAAAVVVIFAVPIVEVIRRRVSRHTPHPRRD